MLCSPMLSWLRARGVPSGIAILLIVLSVILAGTLVGIVVGDAVRAFNNDLPSYQLRLQEMTAELIPWLNGMGVNINTEQFKEIINPGVAMQMAGNVVAGFSNTMANAFMILLTVIFILAEEAGFAAKLVHARGGSTTALEALERFSKAVNDYMGLKTLISLGTGLLAYILLLIIGVDYAVMWAMLAFLLNFVPTPLAPFLRRCRRYYWRWCS